MADAASPDVGEVKDKQTRRTFLKNAFFAALGGIAGVLVYHHSRSSTSPAELSAKLSPSEPPKMNPELIPFMENHPLLINLTDYQKLVMSSYLTQQIRYYERLSEDTEVASLIEAAPLDVKERAQQSASYQELIDKKADLLDIDEQSFIRKIASSLVFVESEGEEESNLFQLEAPIAKDVAEKLGIELGEKMKHLNNRDINAMIALAYLKRLYRVFPDPTLAVWAFNLGEQIMSNAIYAYVMGTANTESQQEAIKQKFKSKTEVATTYYVGFMKINYVNLFQSQEAAESITKDLAEHGEPYDQVHQFYVPKVLAGDYLIQSLPKS